MGREKGKAKHTKQIQHYHKTEIGTEKRERLREREKGKAKAKVKEEGS
jgi:hypothetical protein